jgi:HD-GYP domain-containing protein (c-di-GMP phosphodiesterase class II)
MKRAIKLRPVLFLLILLAGLVPLAISTGVLIRPNRDLLRTQEQTELTRMAEALSRDVNLELAQTRQQLEILGLALLALPEEPGTGELLAQDWVFRYLETFTRRYPEWLRFAVLNEAGQGPLLTSVPSTPELTAQGAAAFNEAAASGRPAYRFLQLQSGQPAVVVLVPAADAGGRRIFLEAVVQPRRLAADLTASTGAGGSGNTFLIDRTGQLIWSSVGSPEEQEKLVDSDLVRSFVRRPLPLTEIYEAELDGKMRRVIGIVSPIEETGWGVVAHRPESAAFVSVRRLLLTALISTLALVLLALLLAYLASAWIGQPIQRLVQTTRAMAEGNFSSRVDTGGMRFELADLAEDFNLMGGHVEQYVERLQRAAQANRELFIGSLRAFTAAIDAKDPYTRGHSERVAAGSRVIARSLGLAEDFQNKLWIAALLHDVGKIGIEDKILKKGGVLSAEEYEQMKRHTVIGAEIMSSIDQLKGALPVIRWHHENWNGRGYPDGLKGEQIPLMARIVAVADTFDAITTNRPYQNAYTLEYAVETITKLTGTRFDAKVVTAFLKAVDQGQIRSREEAEPATDAGTSLAASASA